MSPQVMNLSRDARLLFIGLITQADDDGRGVADPRKLKAAIFGGDDDISSSRVGGLLVEIEAQRLCVLYKCEAEGTLYCLPSFREHQYIQKPKKSAYPAPPGTDTGLVPDSYRTGTGGSEGSEGSYRRDLKDRKDLRGFAKNDEEEIERRRQQAASIAESLAANKRTQ